MGDDEHIPLAVRRERRSNFGVRVKKDPDTLPEIKTPRRGGRKKVRFSDPGMSNSGLTPMLNRTALLGTPSSRRRRASTPTATRRYNVDSPSRQQQSSDKNSSSNCLRHVLDGRVERHQRRTALRTALDKLDSKHQESATKAKSQISNLKNELKARDREIYELQNATIVIDTDRIYDLEQQVNDLRQQLHDAQDERIPQPAHAHSTIVDWTTAARDPFEEYSYMDIDTTQYIANDDTDHFGDATMAQLTTSTPSRARRSLMSPPETSPIQPGMQTPTSTSRTKLPLNLPPYPNSTPADAGVQASLPDPEVLLRQVEVESLRRESAKLATTLASYEQLMGRLKARLPALSEADAATTTDASNTNDGDTLEHQIDAVLSTLSERTDSLQKMTASISSLGFPGNDASDMLKSMSAAFRSARLELEYLTPGEFTLPLSSCGAEVLTLILEQLRDLSRRVKEGEESVDEYHAIELNLRQQLDARVSVMDDLRSKLSKAEGTLGDKNTRIQELEVGNDRLKGAVNGYIRDMSELERLVESMEAEGASKDSTVTEKDETIADLENRLKDATQRAEELKDELEVAQASRKKHLASVNRRSGEALAIRDARVSELRGEIDRVNEALKKAHADICKLRVERGGLKEENQSLKDVVENMKGELRRVMRMSEELMAARDNGDDDDDNDGDSGLQESVEGPGRNSTGLSGQYLNGKLARRSNGVKRDSGLGFLNEEEVDM